MMTEEIRSMSYGELLAELMAKIEEKQQTEAGRKDLADNAARYSNAIRVARGGAAREMQAELGRKIQPTN